MNAKTAMDATTIGRTRRPKIRRARVPSVAPSNKPDIARHARDATTETVRLMIKKEAISATAYKSHIELEFTPRDSLKVAVFNILDAKDIDKIELIKKINNLDRDKHDNFISMDLKRTAFAYSELDVDGALEFFTRLRKEL